MTTPSFRLLAPLLAAQLFATSSAAQSLPPAVRAAAEGIDPSRIERDVAWLASDALRGRDTFSPGFDSAAHFIVRRLAAAGLEPFGDDGTFFQHYVVRRDVIDTAGAYLEIRGRRIRFGDMLVSPGDGLPLTTSASVVYAGHGWRIPSRGIDPYEGMDVAGKIVLVHGGALPPGIDGGDLPPDAESVALVARRHGAAAVISIAPATTLARWPAMRSSRFFRTFQNLDPDVPSAYSTAGRRGVIHLRPEALAVLLSGERVTADSVVRGAGAGRFVRTFELAARATVHLPIESSERLTAYSVVARIPGRDPALLDRHVTIAAHLDGAVGTAPVRGDSIYNAADDNASGSIGILAVAERMMRAPRPRRSVVFIWDSGEEVGLWGTRAFVGRPVIPLASIDAHFNIDMIGTTRAPGTVDSASVDVAGPNEAYVVGPRVLSAAMDSLVHRVNREYPRMRLNHRFDRPEAERFYPRTDGSPFLERGVLVTDFFTGRHPRYHQPQDEARFLDPEKIAAISRLLLVVAWTVADAEVAPAIDRSMPERVPRHED